MSIPGVSVVGDRINPGFKATKALVEAEDIPGLQALAVRQVQAGAWCLDVTVGPRGYKDFKFLTEVIKALQNAVDVPLCFDYPSAEVQEVCLKAYDPTKAKGRKPLVNSLAETRLEMLELVKIRPFQAILMASERLEDGAPKSNKLTNEVVEVARRLKDKLTKERGFSPQDLFVDVTVHSLVSDLEGLTKMALDAIRSIRQDPDLQGVHIIGGLTNIGNMMPPLKFDGVPLKQLVEDAFLTLAVPLGFDTIMGTPWNDFRTLPDDHIVLQTVRDFTQLTGLPAMRRLRQLWAQSQDAKSVAHQ
ncbi:MAG TPA: dihydropteroate synthase [Candidatus Dormibacteraeota bacterium]|nr:dihydropteroate synthase [Candidatus Dormibacteraeota bacterium]